MDKKAEAVVNVRIRRALLLPVKMLALQRNQSITDLVSEVVEREVRQSAQGATEPSQ